MRKADNLSTFMYRLSWNLRASTYWNPLGLSRPVMGLLYLYLYFHISTSRSMCVVPNMAVDGSSLISCSPLFCSGFFWVIWKLFQTPLLLLVSLLLSHSTCLNICYEVLIYVKIFTASFLTIFLSPEMTLLLLLLLLLLFYVLSYFYSSLMAVI